MRKRPQPLGPLALVACCLLLCLGPSSACQSEPPTLLQLFDVTPAHVETHDTLVLRGAGFPPGELGLLELEGTLHRVGTPALESFEHRAEVRSESDERVLWPVDPETVRALTETEEGPRHATFRGKATISFAPHLKGAPPLRGSGEIVFDVHRPKDGQDAAELASALTTFYGAEMRGGPNGVELLGLVPEGRLAKAGAVPGDRIVVFSGVSALTPADLEPHPGQRVATLEFEKPSALPTDPTVTSFVETAGYRPRPAHWWGVGLGLLLPLALGLMLSQSHWFHALGWLLTRTLRKTEPLLTFGERRKAIQLDGLPKGFGAFLGVSTVFAAIHVELLSGARDLDLAWVYFAVASLEFAGAFGGGGYRDRRWSLWRALLASLANLPLQLTLALALFALVLERGSLGLASAPAGELADWLSPSAFVAIALLLVLSVGVSDWAEPFNRRRRSAGPLAFLENTASLLLLATGVALFCGGWHTPRWLGTGVSTQLGFFELKFTLAYILWLFARRVLEEVGGAGTRTLVSRLLLPLSILAVLLVPVWQADVWAEWTRASVRVGLGVLALLCVATGALMAFRARKWAGTTHTVNPWI